MNNIVNLSFPVRGTTLPSDQNYRLYAALCKQCPPLHELSGFALNTISGIPNQSGQIQLTSKSRLLLRLPVEAIAIVYSLTGQQLEIGGHAIQLGNPELQTLKPVDSLQARLVTIKGYHEPSSFLVAAQRQLEALDINANIGIPANTQGEPKRLTLKINKENEPENRSYTIIGFSVVVSDLKPEDSIKLQIQGLGGKRRLGCGVFSPNLPVSKGQKGMRHAETAIS